MYFGSKDAETIDEQWLNLTEINPKVTAIDIEVSLRGKSLGGKAIVQGLKVARGAIEDRFRKRIKTIARTLSQGLA